MIAAWAYEAGFAEHLRSIATLRRRIARGRERAGDREELEAYELSLAELRALYRADRRLELEFYSVGETPDVLDVALVQCEELVADGLPLRGLSPGLREALRREREADFAVILYGFADSGNRSVTT